MVLTSRALASSTLHSPGRHTEALLTWCTSPGGRWRTPGLAEKVRVSEVAEVAARWTPPGRTTFHTFTWCSSTWGREGDLTTRGTW